MRCWLSLAVAVYKGEGQGEMSTEFQDDIDLVALRTLSESEEALLRAQAALDPTFAVDLRAAEELVSRFAYATPVVPAPPELRAAVMARVRLAPAPTTAPPLPSTPLATASPRAALLSPADGRPPRRLPLRRLLVLAAATVMPLAALVFWNTTLQRQVHDLRQQTDHINRQMDGMERRQEGLLLFASPATVKGSFSRLADAPAALGGMSWMPERGRCDVWFEGLPKPADGSAYRLWIVVDKGAIVVPAETLSVDANGGAYVILDASRWRGQDYDVQLRQEQRANDPEAPVLMTASVRRP